MTRSLIPILNFLHTTCAFDRIETAKSKNCKTDLTEITTVFEKNRHIQVRYWIIPFNNHSRYRNYAAAIHLYCHCPSGDKAAPRWAVWRVAAETTSHVTSAIILWVTVLFYSGQTKFEIRLLASCCPGHELGSVILKWHGNEGDNRLFRAVISWWTWRTGLKE